MLNDERHMANGKGSPDRTRLIWRSKLGTRTSPRSAAFNLLWSVYNLSIGLLLGSSHRLDHYDFFAEHVGNLDSDSGFRFRSGKLILTGNQVGFLFGHVGTGDVEDFAVVGGVNHHAVHHRTPVF